MIIKGAYDSGVHLIDTISVSLVMDTHEERLAMKNMRAKVLVVLKG